MIAEPIAGGGNERGLNLAESAASYILTRADVVAVHARVLEVARMVLDADGAAAVALFVKGLNQQEAAKALGWSTTKMSRVLHGSTPGSNSGKKSAVQMLRGALRMDPTFIAIYEAIRATFEARGGEERVREPPPDAVITEWFRSCVRPPKPGLMVPLVVLLVADRLADRKRELRFEDLQQHVPGFCVSQAVGPLQVLGYIRTDGVTIRILKTPVDDIKAQLSAGQAEPVGDFVNGIISEMAKEAAP